MTSGSVSPAVDAVPIAAPESPASRLLLRPWKHMLMHRGWPTMQYLARTEAHTYAFSVAANAILSFFPFMVLLMWLITRSALRPFAWFDGFARVSLDVTARW